MVGRFKSSSPTSLLYKSRLSILSTLYTKEEELGGRPCLFLSSIYIRRGETLFLEWEREDLRWLWLDDGCLKEIPIIRLSSPGSLRWVKKEMGRMSLHHLTAERSLRVCLTAISMQNWWCRTSQSHSRRWGYLNISSSCLKPPVHLCRTSPENSRGLFI